MIESHSLHGGIRVTLRTPDGKSRVIEDIQEFTDKSSNIEFLVTNFEGRVESKTSIPFRSFTGNFIGVIANKTQLNSSFVAKRTDGTTSSASSYIQYYLDLVNPYSSNALGASGIVLGTGSVSKSISDYKLGGIITHGSGSKQLVYGNCLGNTSFSQTAVIGSSSVLTISRGITNLSSSTIYISEAGLYAGRGGSSTKNCMLARDTTDYSGSVINIPVNPSSSITVKYNLGFSLSSGWVKNIGDIISTLATSANKTGYTRTVTNINGDNYSNNDTYSPLQLSTIEGYTIEGYTIGAVCGSSSVAQSPDNYKIYGLYNHGTGSNQLFYDAVQVLKAPTDFGSDVSDFIVYRDIFNYSSNPITISEVGWYSGQITYPRYTYLINRKVLSEPIVLQPDSSLRVELVFMTKYL